MLVAHFHFGIFVLFFQENIGNLATKHLQKVDQKCSKRKEELLYLPLMLYSFLVEAITFLSREFKDKYKVLKFSGL